MSVQHLLKSMKMDKIGGIFLIRHCQSLWVVSSHAYAVLAKNSKPVAVNFYKSLLINHHDINKQSIKYLAF